MLSLKDRRARTALVHKLDQGLIDLTQIMTAEQEQQYLAFHMNAQSQRNTVMDYKNDGFVTILHGPHAFHHKDLDILLQPRYPGEGEKPVVRASPTIPVNPGGSGAPKGTKGPMVQVLDYLEFLKGIRP